MGDGGGGYASGSEGGVSGENTAKNKKPILFGNILTFVYIRTILTTGGEIMKTGNAVREIMKVQEIGVNQMAARLGKTPRLVSERLNQENISIAKLQEMLRVLDYKVVIVPREVRVPEGGFEVE